MVNSSDEHESIVGWDCYPNNEKLIQLYPSPEFLNSLSFIKKFYPVLNLLHAPRVPQKQLGCSLLHLLAIRTRCTPSVRKFALPVGAREKFTKGSHENSCNSRHSEAQSQSAKWLQKTRRSAGLFCNYVGTFNANENFQAKESSLFQYKASPKNENNSTETDHASMPLGVFASKSVSIKTKNQIAYPSKSSLTE